MAKETLRYKVLREADVYATDFQLKLRYSTVQSDLKKFVAHFENHPEYVAKFIIVVNQNSNNDRKGNE